ncbi:MAG: UDP-N-acetylglucosamine 2-epimerase (hydrolyzing) [Muribaculaceae bacterium]|nr:UDP-N-acetylglucosamine 2-epimerase (hydrolyzing) [Muribaculaceae bacterium]
MNRKVCIVTGTRADWGLLSGIARELKKREQVELQIVATNMHLSHRYGYTVNEIISDGFSIDAEVPMPENSGNHAGTAKAMGICLTGISEAFSRLQPDVTVILGDRYEMLAVAAAATVMRIPIIHIAGGAISEGAIDDSIRHAITKLSSLHLTETECYRQRVIQMGESPDHVINTGAIGVYNILNETLMPRSELEKSIGTTIGKNTLLVTLHPATLDTVPVEYRCKSLLDALDNFPDYNIIFTYPNNDANGRIIIDMIENYASLNGKRVTVIPSLGKKRYLSALKYVAAVIGNSSSGIVEVPSMGIPTVDIGIRQRGRMASESVIHCAEDSKSITDAIALALSPAGQENARKATNPYYKQDTLQTIADAVANTPLESLHHKKFYDLNNG